MAYSEQPRGTLMWQQVTHVEVFSASSGWMNLVDEDNYFIERPLVGLLLSHSGSG
jgi:hypothetical protein